MTRRVIVYKRGNLYLVSQEFNGDYKESAYFGLQPLPETADWNNVKAEFDDRPADFVNFYEAVRRAEMFYGSEHEKIIETTEPHFDTYDEVWEFTKKGLILINKEEH